MKTAFLSALAALLLIVPASASAGPQFSASVSSVEFGSSYDSSGAFDPFDHQTYAKSITITNTGDMNITSVDPSFASAPGESPFHVMPDPYSLSNGDCESYNPGIGSNIQFSIDSGGFGSGSCQFQVLFNPQGLSDGEHTETLKLKAYGMPGPVEGNSIEIPISADVAQNGDATISATELDLGAVPVDTTVTDTVTLTSTGTSPVRWGLPPEIKFEDGSYPLVPPFTVSLPETCDQVSPGETCDVEVSFTPRSPISYDLNLWLYGSFGTFKVALHGSGFDKSEVEVTPSLQFGEMFVGSKTTRTAGLTTTSFAPANLESASISGPGASSYSVEYDANSCKNLATGTGCELEVTYEPSAIGEHMADLKVTGDFGERTIRLSGSAREPTAARLAIRAFGPFKAGPGTTVKLKAKIYNLGETTARRVTLSTSVQRSLAAKIKPIKIKSIAPGKPVTRTIRIRVKKSAKPGRRIKVRVVVSAKSAKSGSTRRGIRVR